MTNVCFTMVNTIELVTMKMGTSVLAPRLDICEMLVQD
jgi:hypothetical protein